MATILNWGSSVGNRTIDTNGFFLIPETEAQRFDRTGDSLPANLIGKNDYGLGFKFTVEAGVGTFVLDDNGLKISSGLAIYSAPPSGVDDLRAIGYPPGVLSSGVYNYALYLTTIRLGDEDSSFALIGQGITQSLSAEVNKEASQGYIFQSNIFAGGGDDYVSVLMPWQSLFKGGSNTIYYDAVFGTDPGGGIPVTLDDDLTLEEVPYGDLIVLKGSRFDWDIEFKDGDGDGRVTLASILDERDYIAVSNNNRIYGFERILFGDILFDLILARQQDSSAVFGQPDYFLNGAENQAPELNSTIASGSQLWEAFRFNRTKLQGITGTATQPIEVHTGDAPDTPFLVGALQFASLFTEGGNDIAEIGDVDQALIDLGRGSDQLRVNGTVSRSEIRGGDGDGQDNIILHTASNSIVTGGRGDDIIEVRASAAGTVFDGGGDSGDTLILPDAFSIFNLISSNSGGVTTFTDEFGNSFTGFPTIRFSDITLDALQTLSLSGPSLVNEGDNAEYVISLDGSSLARGQSVAFRLQVASDTAQLSSDLVPLVESVLQAAPGIVLSNVSVDTASGLIRVVASATRIFNANDPIVTLRLPVLADLQAEPDERFAVTLSDFVQATTQPTTIRNVAPLTIRLDGPDFVLEGQIATYQIVLDGVSLAAGRGLTLSLKSAGNTATQGIDFDTLVGSSLQQVDGVSLSAISTAADGTVTVTATNSSSLALADGATLLTVRLPVTTDAAVEGPETFAVTLTSSTALVSGGLVTTTIDDLVPTPTIALIGQSTVIEGQSAAYAVSLDGSGLLAGQSITLTLDTASGTALEGVDFAALTAGAITAGSGVTLSGISTDPVTKAVTLTATNTSGASLAAGAQLLSISIPTTADVFAEAAETFSLSLSSATATVSAGADLITTTISDNNPLAVRIAGPASVAEGSTTSPYTISLASGVGLGAGRSVTFSMDTANGTATKGVDFAALVAAGLSAASGITLVTSPAGDGTITVTASNSSGADLAEGSALLSFAVTTSNDLIAEGNETFSINLAGGAGVAVAEPAKVSTTISDDDPLAIQLSGPKSLTEGQLSQPYILSLGPVGLAAGQSIPLQLGLRSGSAQAGTDLSALGFSQLKLASGLAISDRTTLADGTLSFSLINRAKRDLDPRSQLLSFQLNPLADKVMEGTESFSLRASLQGSLSSQVQLAVSIADSDKATLALRGPASVSEGGLTKPFQVDLGTAALAQGQQLQLTLGLKGLGGVSLAKDYQPLSTADFQLASGLSIAESRQLGNGGLQLQLRNERSQPIPVGTALVQFRVQTNADELIEKGEAVEVSLSSRSAGINPSARRVRTAIVDTSKPAIEPPPDNGGDGGSLQPPPSKVINGTPGPDVLVGSLLNNVIYGDKGADLITGGGGSNVFRFNLRDGLNQGDVITDFRPGADVIRVEGVSRNSLAAVAFGGKTLLQSALAKSAFEMVDTLDRADGSKAVFLYARLTGELAFNANGNGSGFGREGGVIASLPVLLDFNPRDLQLAYVS